ncbi:MAG: Flp family type IVb pilin [Alphaproteobacteria bacterium]|jgi:pilus assembly protein Flp/PilA|nr:Flp family type IVb pilin [Alphaproteobacteria bacterium]
MKILFRRFLQDTNGVAALEYGIQAALIAVAIIPSVTFLGQQLSSTFRKVSSSIAVANTQS